MMRNPVLFGLSALFGAAAAVCIWLVVLLLGPHYPVALRTMAGGGTVFFYWDLLAALAVLYAIYLGIARFARVRRPIRTRVGVAFLVALLCCLSLSFKKFYVSSHPIKPFTVAHRANGG